MLLKDVMDTRVKDIKTSIFLPENIQIADIDLSIFNNNHDEYISVLNDEGNRIGSIKKEYLKYTVEKMKTMSFWASEIFNCIKVGIIVVSKEGRIYFANRAYEEILGISLKKIWGRLLNEIEPGTALSKVLITKEPCKVESQLIKTVGKYVSTNIYPLYIKDRFEGAFSVFSDVTEINQLNQEVKHMTQISEMYANQIKAKELLKEYQIIGEHTSYINCIEKAIVSAKTDATVLLRGETGVGKEVFSRILKYNSKRNDKKFITVNCSAIPEDLLESELIGYVEGAFTGAKKGGAMGKFQLADGGTLFLDEIGDMPLSMQSKLLRVLQEGEIEKVGRQENIPVDVRIIAATNRPLESMIKEGKFRMDLYYRLNVITITIPPLRERGYDIILLANHFLDIYNIKYNKNIKISKEVYNFFMKYPWQGNVRELQNVIESIVILCSGDMAAIGDLPKFIEETHCYEKVNLESASDAFPIYKTLKEEISAFEKKVILETLERFKGDRKKAMEALGLPKRTFYRKLGQI